uniref:Uncharacterized protein n=1 Tax=Panagrolaimus superbus TaxID=310955 RepID=A0A914YE42_9BILA
MAPELSQHLPVLILVGVILATVCILCCRKNSSSKKKKVEAARAAAERDEEALNLNLSGSDVRELPSLSEPRGAELLDSTVYASVGRPRRNTLKDIVEEEPSPATIRRQPSLQQAAAGGINLETFGAGPQPPHCKITPMKIPLGAAGSAFKPTPLASIAKQSRSGPITGFQSSSISNPLMNSSKYQHHQPRGSLDAQKSKLHSHSNTQLKQNQYWV